MSAVLVVRPSSLGDIVYALAIASDIRRHKPDLAIDWVAERLDFISDFPAMEAARARRRQ